MGFNSNTTGKQVFEYAPADTFSALLSALEKSSAFSVKSSSSSARTISVQTGISWKSWGENLTITVSPAPDGFSQVSIMSTTKFGMVDWGKNQDNFNSILRLLSEELQNYEKVVPAQKANPDIISQIAKLAELKDAGILTEDEFRKKKEELLSKL